MNLKRAKSNLCLRSVTHIPMSNSLRVKFTKWGGILGSRVHISEGVIFDGLYPENISIGNYVHITMRCIILTRYLNTNSIGTKRQWRKGNVKIEDFAFIGANTIICNDVTIGTHSIVGAGSVVTKDIPPHEIWGGNPARFIKKIAFDVAQD